MNIEAENLDSLRKLVRELQAENTVLKEKLKKANIAYPESNVFEEKIEELKEAGQTEYATQYETSWKIIMNVLDEIVLVFGDIKVSFDKYMQILKTGLSSSDLGKIPGTQDQVIIGDVDRSRSHKVRAIFIIGLNDGMFPSVHKTEGFFNDEDRTFLKEKGFESLQAYMDEKKDMFISISDSIDEQNNTLEKFVSDKGSIQFVYIDDKKYLKYMYNSIPSIKNSAKGFLCYQLERKLDYLQIKTYL